MEDDFHILVNKYDLEKREFRLWGFSGYTDLKHCFKFH